MKKRVNLEICSPWTDSNQFDVLVSPGLIYNYFTSFRSESTC